VKDALMLLNIGCGNTFHSDWINLDLISRHPQVQQHDLTSGIPFDDVTFDAVYHSHVLEHLTKESAERLISECFRLLKPGGVLRIAIPDLAEIAKNYLAEFEAASQNPTTQNLANHHWMQLELLDQLVRVESGGQMGRFMSQTDLPNEAFVRWRMGAEFLGCRNGVQLEPSQQSTASDSLAKPRGFKARWQRKALRLREKITRAFLCKLYGRAVYDNFIEACFRCQGEIHRWMYDAVSLRSLLERIGFHDVQQMSATESRIASFSMYQLDTCGDSIRKPDSLFMEAIAPPETGLKV
jgi:predicted SAM-dependent methyltransferase